MSDTPSGEGMAAREAAIIAKRREKEGMTSPADWTAGVEDRLGRRRRSVSTGDLKSEAEAVSIGFCPHFPASLRWRMLSLTDDACSRALIQ